MRLSLLSSALTSALLCQAGPLHATQCDPAGGVSSCLDADALWLAGGRAEFLALEPTGRTPEGYVATSVGTSYAHKPVVLNVPSPDPDGRDINVIRHLVTTTLLMTYAPIAAWEVSLSAPFTPLQDGAGTEAIASRVSPPLIGTAVRDPRLGLAYVAALTEISNLRAQADVMLPLGDEHALAGDPAIGVAPRVTVGANLAPLQLSGALGGRIRESVPFASARWGSELSTALGAALHVLPQERLSVALEGHLRSSLVEQPGDALLAPAEWMLSLRSAPFADEGIVLQLGGGTAVPLSSATRDGETEHFAGLTAPRVRGVFVVRYAPAVVP